MTWTDPDTGQVLDLVVLTRWMADNGHSADDVAYAVEKPWKFREEYSHALSEDAIEGLRQIERELRP